MIEWYTHEHRSQHPYPTGAVTYSEDILATQKGRWESFIGEKESGKNITIATCLPNKKTTARKIDTDLLIQYLHRYRYTNPLQVSRDIASQNESVFITAYKAMKARLINDGHRAVFVPMMIRKPPFFDEEKYSDRIIWFGSLFSTKMPMFRLMKEKTKHHGLQMDVISKGQFNGTPIDRERTFRILSKYRYGIGVGRCALEMYALGIRVIIAGDEFGGIVCNPVDHAAQHGTNFNGRITTFDRDMDSCIECLPDSCIPSQKFIEEISHAELYRLQIYDGY